jgi:hypothetical protein
MMLRTIHSAEPQPASRVRLGWGDGSESVVDLAPVLAKGGVFGRRVRVAQQLARYSL